MGQRLDRFEGKDDWLCCDFLTSIGSLRFTHKRDCLDIRTASLRQNLKLAVALPFHIRSRCYRFEAPFLYILCLRKINDKNPVFQACPDFGGVDN